MDSTNSSKEDSRSISEQEAARQQAEQHAAAQAQHAAAQAQQAEAQAQQAEQMAQQQAQQQAVVEQDALIQQNGLPPVGSNVIANVDGIDGVDPVSGVLMGIEAGMDGESLLVIQTAEGPKYFPIGDAWSFRPAPAGDGTKESPLQATDSRDVDAAVQQNTNQNPSGPENTFLENDERQSPQPKGGGMLRFLIPILIAAGLGYWAYSSRQEGLESERMQQAQEVRRQILKNSVIEMASKANAVTNWATNLADDGGTRRSPVLTAELQKQWVINRPILLLGYIEDIVINPDATYQVNVAHNWVGSPPAFLQNDIRMSLRCPESVAAPLIRAAKTGSWKARFADTAITAVIENILTTEKIDSKGDTTTVLTGMGQCLNAIYLTERISWP